MQLLALVNFIMDASEDADVYAKTEINADTYTDYNMGGTA